MRTLALWTAALSGSLALAGCRAIQGLDELTFDLQGSGGGTSVVEDCANGQDDDGDGQIDCADSDCGAAGYACFADPPKGWSGPAAFYEGPFGQAAPACPSLYPDLAYAGDTGPEAKPATCSECVCGAAEVTCSVELKLFNNINCKGNGTTTGALTPGSCTPLDGAASSLALTPAQATIEPCLPSGGIADVPALERSTSGVACGAVRRSGGCSSGQFCAPRPKAPFREAQCIWRQQHQTCPASYPDQHHLETVMDDRGCTPCACGAPTPSCAATTTLFSDLACGAQIADLPNNNDCVTSLPAAAMTAVTGSGSADCLPKGGAPTGSAAAVSQATICCSE